MFPVQTYPSPEINVFFASFHPAIIPACLPYICFSFPLPGFNFKSSLKGAIKKRKRERRNTLPTAAPMLGHVLICHQQALLSFGVIPPGSRSVLWDCTAFCKEIIDVSAWGCTQCFLTAGMPCICHPLNSF